MAYLLANDTTTCKVLSFIVQETIYQTVSHQLSVSYNIQRHQLKTHHQDHYSKILTSLKSFPSTMPITKWIKPARSSDEETDQEYLVRIDKKYDKYYNDLVAAMTRLELVGLLRDRVWSLLRPHEKENVEYLLAHMKLEARNANAKKMARQKIVLEGPFWKR